MAVDCNYHKIDLPQIVYAKNQNSRYCCGGGILSGLLSGGGCVRGNNFTGGLVTGGILAGIVLLANRFSQGGGLLSGLLGGCSILGGNWLSEASSLLGGSGYCGIPTTMEEFATIFSYSPLGQYQLAMEQEATITKLSEELKPTVDKAIEESGVKIEKDSVEYKDVLAKAGAIKTANPKISDAELKTRLKNYTIASNIDDKLDYLATKEIDKIDIPDGTTEGKSKNAYLNLGKGYVELMDNDCNGKVTVEEFVKHESSNKLLKPEAVEEAKEKAKIIFDILDENRNGNLDAEEFAAYNHMVAIWDDNEVNTANDITTEENTKHAEAQKAVVNDLMSENTELNEDTNSYYSRYYAHLRQFRDLTNPE